MKLVWIAIVMMSVGCGPTVKKTPATDSNADDVVTTNGGVPDDDGDVDSPMDVKVDDPTPDPTPDSPDPDPDWDPDPDPEPDPDPDPDPQPATLIGAECPVAGCPTCFEGTPGDYRGYCTDECNADVDCGADAHCTTDGWCVRDCTSTSDCRDEHTCTDMDFDGVLECWESAVGNLRTGDMCTYHHECGRGVLGYCSYLTEQGHCSSVCNGAGDCDINETCTFGSCRVACITNEHCGAGSDCVDYDRNGIAECMPTGLVGVGAACSEDAHCGTGLICAEDGMCTRDCFFDGACPDGFACRQLYGFCEPECVSSADCAVGQSCAGEGHRGESICI